MELYVSVSVIGSGVMTGHTRNPSKAKEAILTLMILLPIFIIMTSIFFYTLLHFTYPNEILILTLLASVEVFSGPIALVILFAWKNE